MSSEPPLPMSNEYDENRREATGILSAEMKLKGLE
jgi:hypothetical protein